MMEPNAPPLRWVRAETTERLSRQLGLPNPGQDWAFIASDAARIDEFCDLYESGTLDTECQFAVMELIVASLDDLMSIAGATPEQIERVERLLRRDFIANFHTIHYWSCIGREDEVADPDNAFCVTPMMRHIWADCFVPGYNRWIDK